MCVCVCACVCVCVHSTDGICNDEQGLVDVRLSSGMTECLCYTFGFDFINMVVESS